MTDEEINCHVGRRIQQRREELDLSPNEVARRLGVNKSQIEEWEAGRDIIYAPDLYYLARILKAPIASFLEGMEMRKAS